MRAGRSSCAILPCRASSSCLLSVSAAKRSAMRCSFAPTSGCSRYSRVRCSILSSPRQSSSWTSATPLFALTRANVMSCSVALLLMISSISSSTLSESVAIASRSRNKFRASRTIDGIGRCFQLLRYIVTTDERRVLVLRASRWGLGEPVPMLSQITGHSLYPDTLDTKWK